MKQWYEPYQIINENQNAEIQTSAEVISNNLVELCVTINFAAVCVPKKITLCFRTPCVDLYSIWGTGLRMRQYLPAD